jgi:hypothetical protein
MNYQELTSIESIKSQITIDLITKKSGAHYGTLLGSLAFMPITKAQALNHIRKINNGYDNLLMCGRWVAIESFLNRNGFKGNYSITKSKTMCRLTNMSDYVLALKKELSL